MKLFLNERQTEVFDLVCEKLGRPNVYLVGGFVRNTMLGKTTSDIDFAVKNDPQSVYKAFPYGHYFEKYGTISFSLSDYRITITSLRKESGYKDSRHPDSVTFVKDINIDYKRRDFTVNALYADSDLVIRDPSGRGFKDLQRKRLTLIGNANKRLREDPLRIVRAFRFKYELGMEFSRSLQRAVDKNIPLISKLNPDKVREEMNKCPENARDEIARRIRFQL